MCCVTECCSTINRRNRELMKDRFKNEELLAASHTSQDDVFTRKSGVTKVGDWVEFVHFLLQMVTKKRVKPTEDEVAAIAALPPVYLPSPAATAAAQKQAAATEAQLARATADALLFDAHNFDIAIDVDYACETAKLATSKPQHFVFLAVKEKKKRD